MAWVNRTPHMSPAVRTFPEKRLRFVTVLGSAGNTTNQLEYRPNLVCGRNRADHGLPATRESPLI